MYININMDELASEITRKIRDEISRIRVVDFGEVKATTKLNNGGWTAQVLMSGAESLTNPLNCLSNYIPKVGDWVMIIYPPMSEPVLVDCTPMRENVIITPDDKYANAEDHNHDDRYYTKIQSDEKYAALSHEHDGRYYTKILSDERYAPINHNHDNLYIKKQQESWISPSFLTSWQNTDQDHNPAGYRKNDLNEVKLRGRVSGGLIGDPIWMLPEGYRPQYIETRAAISNNLLAVVEIHPDGNIIPVSGDPSSWISLDGISFDL